MIEEKEFEGYWWRPGEEDNYAGGKVAFSPENGIVLNTFSSFAEGMTTMRLDASDFDRLYGVTTDGNPVTLDTCQVVSSDYKSKKGGSAATLEMKWQYLLIGHHFDDDIVFDRVRVTYPLLDSWSQVSGVNYSGSFFENPSATVSAGDTFNIEYVFPESKTANIGDFELKLLVNANFSIGKTSGAEINETHYFDFIPHDEVIGVETAIEQTGVLQDFLTLAIGKEIRVSKIIGRLKADQGYNDINVYFNTSHHFEVPDSIHPHRMIFTQNDIEDKFDTVLQKWFQKYDDLENTYNLYFSSLYDQQMYLNVQLLTLMQALEAYHRATSEDKYLPEEEYDKFYETIVERLPADLPEDFRSHLEHGTLKYANEYSLRKRLLNILDQHDSIFQSMDIVSEEKLSEAVVTRNYLTHYDENIESVPQGKQMWNQIQVLRVMVESVLLSEIGLSEDQIVENIEEKYAERIS